MSDKEILAILQNPLKIQEEPYSEYAQQLGISQEEVFDTISEYIDNGMIRRISGIVKHTRVGYNTNAMMVFTMPDEECDRAGEILSSFEFVSHCYRRTFHPQWPYNVYAMVHAKDENDMMEKVRLIKEKVPFDTMEILETDKEYKKSAFRIE